MPLTKRYKITVGTSEGESDAQRQRLTAELEQRLIVAGIPASAISQESEYPGQDMAAGTILCFEVAGQVLDKLTNVVRSWLISLRTEIEIETPDGRRVKISAANFDDAVKLLQHTGNS